MDWNDGKWIMVQGDHGSELFTFSGDRVNRTLAKLISIYGLGKASSNYKSVIIKPFDFDSNVNIDSIITFISDLKHKSVGNAGLFLNLFHIESDQEMTNDESAGGNKIYIDTDRRRCNACGLYLNQLPVLDKSKRSNVFWVGLSSVLITDEDEKVVQYTYFQSNIPVISYLMPEEPYGLLPVWRRY